MTDEKNNPQVETPNNDAIEEKPQAAPSAPQADDDATVVQSLEALKQAAPKTKVQAAARVEEEVIAAPKQVYINQGNPLGNLITPLLTIVAELRLPHENIDLSKLRQHLSLEINSFDVAAKNNGVPESVVLLARYVICAVADEFVLDTPWGANSNWSEFSLLNTFHQDSAGGEKFFTILEKIQKDSSTNIDLLEVMYQCLALGFVGKFRIMHGGKDKLSQTKEKVYQQISRQRGKNDFTLAARAATLNPKVINKIKRIPVLRLAGITAIILVLLYIGFASFINSHGNAVVKELRGIVVDNGVNGQRGGN